MNKRIRVKVWNEFRHERKDEWIRQIYPDGIHMTIARALEAHEDLEVSTAVLDEPEHGLTDEALAATDVLFWWGHMAHAEVGDEVVARVHKRVLEGMGLVVLHSGHFSKIFRALMGTSCVLLWREVNERERVWTIEPGHPIAQGIGAYFELPNSEMYGERFDIPTPDALVFASWFEGGEVFRSGCCWERGHGRVFYFSPGHETHPIYHDANVRRVLVNAARWAAPRVTRTQECVMAPALEEIPPREIDCSMVEHMMEASQ